MSASAEHAAEDLQATLAGISTNDLVDELAKREGVEELVIKPERWEFIGHTDYDPKIVYGPARILVVIG